MSQQELLYGYNSTLITAVLFVLIILSNEVGYLVGGRVRSGTDADLKSLTGSIQASTLGLLALLLGFTFSMALQRFDNRSEGLIAEANAIGTALLRVELLPPTQAEEAAGLIARYIELRIDAGKLSLAEADARAAQAAAVLDVQRRLWATAVAATEADPRPVTTGAFMASLNDMIDAQGRRNALLQMHVPEIVLILLFVVFVAAGGILGYTAGLSRRRVRIPTIVVSFLITMVVFIIVDLDRPRRGVIQVDQTPLRDLQLSLPTRTDAK